MKLPAAILFDHDGVLVASEPLHWIAWENLLSQLGLPYNNSEMRTFVGKTAPEILLELLNRYAPGWDPAKYDLAALAQRKNDTYLKLAQTGLAPYPGVREGLDWLRIMGVRTAVVSNARRRELEAALDLLQLRPYLDAVVSRDDVSAPKPDPTPYLFATASLGCRPEQCLAVEDSPTGIEAALMAKIPAAAVLTNFGAHAMQAPVPGRVDLRPIWVGPTMQDFFSWLRSTAVSPNLEARPSS